MGSRNFTNTLAFAGLCLYFALLINGEKDTCKEEDKHDWLAYIGCKGIFTIEASNGSVIECSVAQTYNCTNVRYAQDALRVTQIGHCIVNEEIWQLNEQHPLYDWFHLLCKCDDDFPTIDSCWVPLGFFVESVLDRVEEIHPRAQTNLTGNKD